MYGKSNTNLNNSSSRKTKLTLCRTPNITDDGDDTGCNDISQDTVIQYQSSSGNTLNWNDTSSNGTFAKEVDYSKPKYTLRYTSRIGHESVSQSCDTSRETSHNISHETNRHNLDLSINHVLYNLPFIINLFIVLHLLLYLLKINFIILGYIRYVNNFS